MTNFPQGDTDDNARKRGIHTGSPKPGVSIAPHKSLIRTISELKVQFGTTGENRICIFLIFLLLDVVGNLSHCHLLPSFKSSISLRWMGIQREPYNISIMEYLQCFASKQNDSMCVCVRARARVCVCALTSTCNINKH